MKKFNSKFEKLEYLIYNIQNIIRFDKKLKKVDNINKSKQYQLKKKSEKQTSAYLIYLSIFCG